MRHESRTVARGFPLRELSESESFEIKGRIVMPITGSCHCGANAFEIEGEIPEKLTRCTCSFCAKRGALLAYFQPQQFKLTTPAGNLATYRWNSKLVAHNFCPSCGLFGHNPQVRCECATV